jgi:hypothetical protein
MLASGANIIAIGPQLASPVRASQARKLSIQLSGSNALDDIHHLCRSVAGWTTDKQVHMIYLDCQRLNQPLPRLADIANQFLQSLCNISLQYLTAIARNPYKVIGQSIDCMGATACFHSADYIMTRARGPLRGPHSAGHASRSLFPPCGGPAFLPAASGGVSSRRIS